MRKFLMVAILMASSVCTFAQKGEKAAGINLNFGTTANSVGLGAKFQYGLTDKIRIEPSLTYYFGGNGMFDVTANAHYLFNVTPKINIYPLAGIGLYMYSYKTIEDDASENISEDSYEPTLKTSNETDTEFKFNFGAGAEYDITKCISAGLELRYEVITGGYSQFVVGIGAKYKF